MSPIICYVFVLLISTSEFGNGFKLFPEFYNVNKGVDKNTPPAVYQSANAVPNNKPNEIQNIKPNVKNQSIANSVTPQLQNPEEPLIFVPLMDGEMMNPNNFYPIAPPPAPLPCATGLDNLQSFSSINQFPNIFYDDTPYSANQPYTSYQSNEEPDFSMPLSFQWPMLSNLVADILTLNKPIPYQPMNYIESPAAPPEVGNEMVKKIFEIVKDFEKSNKTLLDDFSLDMSREDLRGESEESNAIASSVAPMTENEKINTTEKNSATVTDESRMELLNETETTETEKPEITTLTTPSPSRYVVEQFIDQNGNPCAKEVILTSAKKTYYVYTCEEKGISRSTTARSDVTRYSDELTTTLDATFTTKEDVSSTVTPQVNEKEDSTVPQTLDDFIFVKVP